MCNSLRLFVLTVVLATTAAVSTAAAEKISKPAAQEKSVTVADPAPAPAFTTEKRVREILAEETQVFASAEGLKRINLRLVEVEGKLMTITAVFLTIVVILILVFSFRFIFRHRPTRIDHSSDHVDPNRAGIGHWGLMAVVAVIGLVLFAISASAAVTLDRVLPASFSPGTSTPIQLCTKAAFEDLRVAGSGVKIESATVSGDCVKATLKVESSATVGKRAIEVQETAGGSFAPTGSEIEIMPASAPPTPPTPPTPPAPTVDPRITRLEGQVAALKLTIEGICGADDQWKKDAWGIKRGTSNPAGVACRVAIKHEAVEAAVSDDRLKQSLSDALEAFGKNLPAAADEAAVRGWVRSEAEPLKSDIATLRKDVDGHAEGIKKLRGDVDANTSAITDVREKAAALRQLLAEKGSRGIRKALKTPPSTAATPAPREKGPGFKAADKK